MSNSNARARQRHRQLRLGIAVVVLLVPAIILSIICAGSGTFDLDVRLMEAVQDATPSWSRPLFDALNWVGSFGPLATITIVVAVLLWRRDLRLDAAWLLLVAGLSQLANRALKYIINSPRPPVSYVLGKVQRESVGFPSGHTMSTLMIVGFLIFLALVHLSGWLRSLVVVLGVLVIMLMGMARIVVGEHWPSDVLGGYLWGGATLLALIALYWRIAERRSASTAKTSSSGKSQASSITSK